jgi:nitrogen regulatory protein PII
MSVLAHIGRGIDKQVITAIVEAGIGKPLLQKFCEAPGVLSISHHHARGVGTQRIRSGQMYFKERDVLLVLVESEHADRLFAEIFDAGQIGRPGGGVIFAEQVLRGHPLMPFEGADW